MNKKRKFLVSFLLLFVLTVCIYTGHKVRMHIQALNYAIGDNMYTGIWELTMEINLRQGAFDEVSPDPYARQQWAASVYPGSMLIHEGIQAAMAFEPDFFREEDVGLSPGQFYAIRMFILQGYGTLQHTANNVDAFTSEYSDRYIQDLSDFSMVFKLAFSYAEDQNISYCLSAIYHGMEQFYVQNGRYALNVELPT